MNTQQQVDERRGATSASNALYDTLCGGRHLAQRGMPDRENKDSSKGSRIHAALEAGSPAGLTLDEEEVFTACREIEARKVEEFFGNADTSKAKPFKEERHWVRFSAAGRTFEHSGKLDKVWRYGSAALVIEYKTLLGDVPESNRNPQLRDQAVLYFGNVSMLDKVGVVVVQPLVERNPEICVYQKDDLALATDQLFARVARSNDPAAPRIAGDIQCKFCLAKTNCEAYSRHIGTMLPSADTDAAEPVARALLFQVAMVNWSPEQRTLAASILPGATKALEEMKAFLKEGIQANPGFVPGYTLSKGRTTEKITDPATCFQRFNVKGGTVDQFMACVSVGKTKLRTALAEVTKAKGKGLDTAMAMLTDGITETSVSDGSLTKVESP